MRIHIHTYIDANIHVCIDANKQVVISRNVYLVIDEAHLIDDIACIPMHKTAAVRDRTRDPRNVALCARDVHERMGGDIELTVDM